MLKLINIIFYHSSLLIFKPVCNSVDNSLKLSEQIEATLNC